MNKFKSFFHKIFLGGQALTKAGFARNLNVLIVRDPRKMGNLPPMRIQIRWARLTSPSYDFLRVERRMGNLLPMRIQIRWARVASPSYSSLVFYDKKLSVGH